MPRVEFRPELIIEEANEGDTLLEVSLYHGLVHAHACGGKARCSTCRVFVTRGGENLTAPTEDEALLAARRGFPPEVRLACQARVSGPVVCRRLVRDAKDIEVLLAQEGGRAGVEAHGVILFCDIRSFTPFAAKSLPYDVVHLLNRYFHVMGDIVLKHGGRIDKYIGDGLLAFFQAAEGQERLTCVRAVSASLEMIEALDEVNAYICEHFYDAWKIGIGLHYGTVILGEVGHPQLMQLTILGDAVNVASRIEGATKRLGVPLLVSQAIHERIGPMLSVASEHRVTLRGRSSKFRLYAVDGVEGCLAGPCSEATRRDHIEFALRSVVRRETAPGFLRLAYHDAAAFDPGSGRGGSNGSVRLAEELGRAENSGSGPYIRMLEPVHESLDRVSWADLIAVAGAMAVRVAGGPHISLELGRVDAPEASPEGCLPSEGAGIEALRIRFEAQGLSLRDLVALSGAHTLGRARGTPLTDDLFTFNNSYFRALLRDDPSRSRLLATDRALLDDPEAYALVLGYVLDETAFFRDFASAYQRMVRIRVPDSQGNGQSVERM